MTALLRVSFRPSDGDPEARLETLADLQGIRLGTVDWTDPHTRPDLPGQWVTATAPITTQPTNPKKGKKR